MKCNDSNDRARAGLLIFLYDGFFLGYVLLMHRFENKFYIVIVTFSMAKQKKKKMK